MSKRRHRTASKVRRGTVNYFRKAVRDLTRMDEHVELHVATSNGISHCSFCGSEINLDASSSCDDCGFDHDDG